MCSMISIGGGEALQLQAKDRCSAGGMIDEAGFRARCDLVSTEKAGYVEEASKLSISLRG